MTSPSSVGPRTALDHALREITCVACGGPEGRVVLSAAEVGCEQRWLERFHHARIAADDAPHGAENGDGGDDAKDRASFTQSAARSVVACTACGTLSREPRPSPEAVEEAYASDAYGVETLQRLARSQDAFFAAKLGQLAADLGDLGAGARVLEIGSFVGGFLNAAARRGWRATGIDVGVETTHFARARGFDVLQGDVLELELPASSFAAVFVWSTFDQLAEPGAVLERAAWLLRPCGRLVLRVPNGRFETACLGLRRAARSALRAHHVLCAQAYNNFVSFPYLTGYTPESLCGSISAHGFRCERVYGDTLVELADERTLPFAVREEARFKRAVARLCRSAERTMGLLFDPWIDVLARRRAA